MPPPFSLTVLGSSSALPAAGRNPSAHILNVHDRYYLIDCGEGTQSRLRKFSIKMQKIEAIFISHLHGDHYYGLPGLLGTLHLLGRTKPLSLYAPAGLKEILTIIHRHSETFLQYPLEFHEINMDENKTLLETEHVRISSFPLKHRIPCAGFLFEEKQWRDRKPRKFAYCSDTKYDEDLCRVTKDVDLLYHEATFMEVHKQKANTTWHSTAAEAGRIAKMAGVKQLLIGHFSARYPIVDELLNEAKMEFPETQAAEEGEIYQV